MTANILTSIAPYVISLVTIVGLIVLMALGTLTVGTGIPIVSLLAGLHVGTNVGNLVSSKSSGA